MKKLNKNLLMGFGTISAVAAPIATVVSCGNDDGLNDEQRRNLAAERAENEKPAEQKYDELVNAQVYRKTDPNNDLGRDIPFVEAWKNHKSWFLGNNEDTVLPDAFENRYLPRDFKLPDDVHSIQEGAFAAATQFYKMSFYVPKVLTMEVAHIVFHRYGVFTAEKK